MELVLGWGVREKQTKHDCLRTVVAITTTIRTSVPGYQDHIRNQGTGVPGYQENIREHGTEIPGYQDYIRDQGQGYQGTRII